MSRSSVERDYTSSSKIRGVRCPTRRPSAGVTSALVRRPPSADRASDLFEALAEGMGVVGEHRLDRVSRDVREIRVVDQLAKVADEGMSAFVGPTIEPAFFCVGSQTSR